MTWFMVAPGHWRRLDLPWRGPSKRADRRARQRNVGAEWARMCRRILGACSEDSGGWGGRKGSRLGGRSDEIARAIVRGGWDQAPESWRIVRARRYLGRRRRRYHGWPG